MSLARARHLNYKKALNTVGYLKNETEYVPWLSAFNNFDFILARFKNEEASKFKVNIYWHLLDWKKKWILTIPKNVQFIYLQNFVLELLKTVYTHLGFQPKQNDTRLEIYNRVLVLNHACQFGHEQCIKDAREEYDKLAKDPENYA